MLWVLHFGMVINGPHVCCIVARSPEDPNMTLIKRLIALEGDWVTIPGSIEVEKIPRVGCGCCAAQQWRLVPDMHLHVSML